MGSLKQVRRGYRGAGSGEGSWMTEMINPCSSEQPERRFQRNRAFICSGSPRSIPAPPALASAATRYNLPCEAFVDGDGAVGEKRLSAQILLMRQTPDNRMMTRPYLKPIQISVFRASFFQAERGAAPSVHGACSLPDPRQHSLARQSPHR